MACKKRVQLAKNGISASGRACRADMREYQQMQTYWKSKEQTACTVTVMDKDEIEKMIAEKYGITTKPIKRLKLEVKQA